MIGYEMGNSARTSLNSGRARRNELRIGVRTTFEFKADATLTRLAYMDNAIDHPNNLPSHLQRNYRITVDNASPIVALILTFMRKAFTFLILCTVLLLSSGCAVLTKSQVKEVKAFAEVSKEYGTLPGEPIRTYGHILRANRIMNVSARDFSDEDARQQGWSELQKANAFDQAYASASEEADAALEVLDTYSELLLTLSSDEFTDSLDASAKSMGEAFDKSVKKYNEAFRKPNGKSEFGLIGGPIAAGIRGGAGIWLRHRQAKYLKKYVTGAQPVVLALTAHVQDLMTNTVMGDLTTLESRLKQDFATAAGRAKRFSYETVESVADAQMQITQSRELCESAAQSAQRFADAHTKLIEKLSRRQTLKTRIEEIKTMATEIKKAQKIQKQLKK